MTAAGPAHTGHPRAVRFNRACPIGTEVEVQAPGRAPYRAKTHNWATGRADGRVVVDLAHGTTPVPVEYIRLPKTEGATHAA